MSDDIHTMFGLTYANYLVLPRTLLQSMPTEWQERFVATLREFHDHFDGLDYEPDGGYFVGCRDERRRFTSDKVPHYNRGRTFIPQPQEHA